jgi:hypothetical protein
MLVQYKGLNRFFKSHAYFPVSVFLLLMLITQFNESISKLFFLCSCSLCVHKPRLYSDVTHDNVTSSGPVTAVANSAHSHADPSVLELLILDSAWRAEWNEWVLRHVGSTCDVVFIDELPLRGSWRKYLPVTRCEIMKVKSACHHEYHPTCLRKRFVASNFRAFHLDYRDPRHGILR